MRPNISEILTSIPTRLWMFALFLSGSVLSIVLQRAADAWVPPGTEATQFSQAVRWVADITVNWPGYLLVAALAAAGPYIWYRARVKPARRHLTSIRPEQSDKGPFDEINPLASRFYQKKIKLTTLSTTRTT